MWARDQDGAGRRRGRGGPGSGPGAGAAGEGRRGPYLSGAGRRSRSLAVPQPARAGMLHAGAATAPLRPRQGAWLRLTFGARSYVLPLAPGWTGSHRHVGCGASAVGAQRRLEGRQGLAGELARPSQAVAPARVPLRGFAFALLAAQCSPSPGVLPALPAVTLATFPRTRLSLVLCSLNSSSLALLACCIYPFFGCSEARSHCVALAVLEFSM